MRKEISSEEIDKLRRGFKRCGHDVVETIIRYRTDHDATLVPAIACGIVRRYLRQEFRLVLDEATEPTPLAALDIDSLTMLEIILDLQEVFDITIENAELKSIQTLGDMLGLLRKKSAPEP